MYPEFLFHSDISFEHPLKVCR